jgi:hypothetical protein
MQKAKRKSGLPFDLPHSAPAAIHSRNVADPRATSLATREGSRGARAMSRVALASSFQRWAPLAGMTVAMAVKYHATHHSHFRCTKPDLQS